MKIKFKLNVFLAVLLLSCVFSGWIFPVIIIFIIVFVFRKATFDYGGKKEAKESLFFWLNTFMAMALGVSAFYLILYLKFTVFA